MTGKELIKELMYYGMDMPVYDPEALPIRCVKLRFCDIIDTMLSVDDDIRPNQIHTFYNIELIRALLECDLSLEVCDRYKCVIVGVEQVGGCLMLQV